MWLSSCSMGNACLICCIVRIALFKCAFYNQTRVDYTPQKQTHPLLFDKPDLAPFNPNIHNLGTSLFNNHTRYQLKDSSCDM